ncbi:MAG: hypothetical protein LBB24_03690, partial [Rickettsiales bacterium]|nr:hypothetical protein [Rickettsiales bacterium]
TDTIDRIIGALGANGVNLLILSGLKYYANGDIWPSYSVVRDSCAKHGVDFEERIAFYGRCEYPGCNEYATKHKLNPANELKLEQGLFVFAQAKLSDYQFFCDRCFTRVSGDRNSSLYLTQHLDRDNK